MEKNRTGSWRVARRIDYRARDDHEEAPVVSSHDRGIPPTPRLLIGVANALLVAHSPESGAAFVHHAGYWSHYDNAAEASSWPLPLASSCEELAKHAAEQGMLIEGPPREGDLFLLRSPVLDAFTRTGIVVGVIGGDAKAQHYYMNARPYYRCLVLEGASSPSGMPGKSAIEMVRNLCPDAGDRFVRWTVADRQRNCVAVPPKGDASRAVQETLERERHFLRRAAWIVSRHKRAVAEDLEQEAKVAIWEIDPTRLDPTEPKDRAYLRRTAVNRMIDQVRKLLRGPRRRRGPSSELTEEEQEAMWRSAGPRDAALRTQQQEEGIRGLGLLTDVEQS